MSSQTIYGKGSEPRKTKEISQEAWDDMFKEIKVTEIEVQRDLFKSEED